MINTIKNYNIFIKLYQCTDVLILYYDNNHINISILVLIFN